jgi:nitrogen fixation NifU-like protein
VQLENLYQDIILDHYKHPRGGTSLVEFDSSAFHVNPTCGDEIDVQIKRGTDGTITIGYEGQGCSISQASASVMTELLDGHSEEDCDRVFGEFREMMHSRGAAEPNEDVLGDAVAFVGVAKYPARIKCALLPWMALQEARGSKEES